MSLVQFNKDYYNLINELSVLGKDTPSSVFLEKALETLQEAEVLFNYDFLYVGKRNKKSKELQLNGYSIEESDNSISFIILDYDETFSMKEISKQDIDSSKEKLTTFLNSILSEEIFDLYYASDDVYRVSELISRRLKNLDNNQFSKIKYLVITNKLSKNKAREIKIEKYNNIETKIEIWSLDRFFELEQSSSGKEKLLIDLKDYGYKGLSALTASEAKSGDFEYYLSVLPGNFLADVYLDHGSRILEGNVRAFLNFSGKINKGLRGTILNNPLMFFPYNNGISATAESIKIENGLITQITDFQIINGGQTTASLALTKLKDKADLSSIFVQMKLTVIKKTEEYEIIVRDIAKYANSQNKVSESDFFSNHPFHRTIEDFSNRLPTITNNLGILTYWYYERSRGKYKQELIKLKGNDLKLYIDKRPKNQVLTKEQLAKYLNTINMQPHIVSQGNQKSFKYSAEEIGPSEEYEKKKHLYNEIYFKKAIASAILFRKADTYINNSDWFVTGGYKSFIVTYTLAKIVQSLPSNLELDYLEIWRKQDLDLIYKIEIQRIGKFIDEFIKDSEGIIVSEYCKKESTWNKLKKIDIKLSNDFLRICKSKEEIKNIEETAKKEKNTEDKMLGEMEIAQLGSDYWLNLLEQGIKNKLLSEKDISLINVAIKSYPLPSPAQAKLILAIRLRLKNEGLKDV